MELDNCSCGCKFFDRSGFGLAFCLSCGKGKRCSLTHELEYCPTDRIPGHQSYTRVKRFKKYLCRAMRQQSASTIPRETWDYLLSRRPYRDTAHIQQTLKSAKLRRKCYDSLPFLTAALCPHQNVPTITQQQKAHALLMFRTIDSTVRTGPFISYLFCLEYILEKIGRKDVCPFVNRIQCPKRRKAYRVRLNEIFGCQEKDILSSFRSQTM